MALITFPSTPAPRRVTWSLQQPGQVNTSEWTGRRQVVTLAGAARWRASVEMPPIVGEANVLAWRAFLAKLQGQFNTFRLPAVESVQITGVSPLVNGASQTGTQLVTDGWGSSGVKMLAGQMITIGDQLLVLTDNVTSASGSATISFMPRLRSSPADNAPITVGTPTAHVALASDVAGWSVDPGKIYGVAFDCEEAF